MEDRTNCTDVEPKSSETQAVHSRPLEEGSLEECNCWVAHVEQRGETEGATSPRERVECAPEGLAQYGGVLKGRKG